jgi:large subunit ribosomal protein L10
MRGLFSFPTDGAPLIGAPQAYRERRKHLAITRERKEELVAEYSRQLGLTDGFIVTEYRGLTVEKVNDLRNRLREPAGGSYTVTKNTLFSIALKNGGWPVPEKLLLGPVAVVFGNGNLPAVAKAVQAFQKDNPDLFIVKGGVVSGSIFGANDVEAVANLPTIDEIHAQIAGLLVQPASALAGLLASATGQLVNVIQAYTDKAGEGAA